jgi:hypothetical protein
LAWATYDVVWHGGADEKSNKMCTIQNDHPSRVFVNPDGCARRSSDLRFLRSFYHPPRMRHAPNPPAIPRRIWRCWPVAAVRQRTHCTYLHETDCTPTTTVQRVASISAISPSSPSSSQKFRLALALLRCTGVVNLRQASSDKHSCHFQRNKRLTPWIKIILDLFRASEFDFKALPVLYLHNAYWI